MCVLDGDIGYFKRKWNIWMQSVIFNENGLLSLNIQYLNPKCNSKSKKGYFNQNAKFPCKSIFLIENGVISLNIQYLYRKCNG